MSRIIYASKMERDAVIAAWTEFRKRERKDAIRPEPRVDGRSYEAGWFAAKEFYTATNPQQADSA